MCSVSAWLLLCYLVLILNICLLLRVLYWKSTQACANTCCKETVTYMRTNKHYVIHILICWLHLYQLVCVCVCVRFIFKIHIRKQYVCVVCIYIFTFIYNCLQWIRKQNNKNKCPWSDLPHWYMRNVEYRVIEDYSLSADSGLVVVAASSWDQLFFSIWDTLEPVI